MTDENIKKDPLKHAPMEQFEVLDNCLQVGNRSLTELASSIGRTPFYAYDQQLITDRVNSLRKVLPDNISLHYAIKANPMQGVVQHLSSLTDGLDVASLGEMRIALKTGINAEKISFAGPGKSTVELDAAISSGVIINIESEGELDRIAKIAEEHKARPRVAVRVNPDFELKTSGMKMAGGPKPFGVDAERVPNMLKRIGELNLDFKGFHIYCGSQNLRSEAIIEAQNQTFELAYRLAEYAPSSVTWLNIGGGFGIPYFPGERRLNLQPVADNLKIQLAECKIRLPKAEVVLELGRYLVAEAGIYVCEVVDRKESRGEIFLITNGGLHHHLAASGNFGQVVRKNYPVCLGNKVEGSSKETVNIVGPLCTPLDILGSKVILPKADLGDLVVVFQSGAYGFTASPQLFLSHPPAHETFVLTDN